MKHDFWLDAWKANKTGFHQDHVHPDLHTHSARFFGDQPQRILVPLCGKSLDLAWMAGQGHEVVGAELSPLATGQLFEQAGLVPEVHDEGSVQRWQSGRLTVFVGDFFALTDAQLGRFSRVWDRAALVALPPDLRPRYTQRLRTLVAEDGAIMINCLRHDLEHGPPHSVPEHEVFRNYGGGQLSLLGSSDQLAQNGRFREAGATEFVVSTWWYQGGS